MAGNLTMNKIDINNIATDHEFEIIDSSLFKNGKFKCKNCKCELIYFKQNDNIYELYLFHNNNIIFSSKKIEDLLKCSEINIISILDP